MLVAEIRVDSPILGVALDHAPDVTAVHEEEYQTRDGIDFMFWAEGGDLEAFEAGLDDDPTVTNADCLAETRGRRLYRVTFTEAGERAATYPSWSDLDISLLDSRGSHEGWRLRMRVPDRAALQGYRDVCVERDIPFALEAVYEQRDGAIPATDRVTDAQREALTTARELGYYDVPRRATLAEIAAELDVSPQAVSERIRRGTAALVDVQFDSPGE